MDMTQGILAGPFGNPNRLEGGTAARLVPGQFARGISIPRTSYGVVVESKPGSKAKESIAWFATDQPQSSVFAPFFADADRYAEVYSRGHQEVFSRDSAWWAFNFVANYMNINYANMFEKVVGPLREQEQKRILDAVGSMEKHGPANKEHLNRLQTDLQETLVSRWWSMSNDLIVLFNDGVYNHPHTLPDGTTAPVLTLGYPAWFLQMIGYTNEFYKAQWVQWSASAPPLLQVGAQGLA